MSGGIDIKVGNKRVGIEVKLAESLQNLEKRRSAGGQLDDYQDEFDEVIVVVAGSSKDKKSENVQTLKKKSEKYGIRFYYIVAK